MKTINLKKGSEEIHLKDRQTGKPIVFEWDYKSFIKDIANSAPERGFTPSELTKRLRVIEAVDKLKEDATQLKLEDADWETLKAAHSTFTWSIVAKCINEFNKIFE
jgi:hypothetical protein